MEATSIFLIDEDPTALRLTGHLLREHYAEEVTLLGTAAASDSTLEVVQRLQPQVIIVAVYPHHPSGLRLLPRLRAMLPDSRIIALGVCFISAYERAALEAGAHAWMIKSTFAEDLLPTIQRVTRAETRRKEQVSVSSLTPPLVRKSGKNGDREVKIMETQSMPLDEATYRHMVALYGDKPEGIALLDAAGIICYLNPAWKGLLGSRDAEVLRLGKNYLDALRVVLEPECYTYISAMARGLRLIVRGERDMVTLEYPHNRAGYWRWFFVQMHVYPLDESWGVLVEQQDITHSLRARAVGDMVYA